MQVAHRPTRTDGPADGRHRIAFGGCHRTASPARKSDGAKLIGQAEVGATGPQAATPAPRGLLLLDRLPAGAECSDDKDLLWAWPAAETAGQQVAAQATSAGLRRGSLVDQVRQPDVANGEVEPRVWRPRAGPGDPPPSADVASARGHSCDWPNKGGALCTPGMGGSTTEGMPAAISGHGDTPRAGWIPRRASRPWGRRSGARARPRWKLTMALRGWPVAGGGRVGAPSRHPLNLMSRRGNDRAGRRDGATARSEGGP